jgi:phosphoribosyl 1,2-cyclic phosphodiesterase
MKVVFWGVRGSLPVPGPKTAKLGGNTSCIEVQAAGQRVIFDAGSGLRVLGNSMMAEGKPVEASLFLSHVHHDHIMGWPFFVPAFVPTSRLRIFGERKNGEGIHDQLAGIMVDPYFPVTLDGAMKAKMTFKDMRDGATARLSGSVVVRARRLNHPNGALGYRLEAVEKRRKKVFAYISDNEHTAYVEKGVLELAKGADAVVFDTAYTTEEYARFKGRGHSTPDEAARIVRSAGARRLFLFHHEMGHDDATMLAIEKRTRSLFPRTFAAREGVPVSL